MSKHLVCVELVVEVTIDDEKFTPEFFEEFTSAIAPYDDIPSIVEHLAWVHATGVEDLDTSLNPFLEGFGPIDEMGIRARVIGTEIDYEGDI